LLKVLSLVCEWFGQPIWACKEGSFAGFECGDHARETGIGEKSVGVLVDEAIGPANLENPPNALDVGVPIEGLAEEVIFISSGGRLLFKKSVTWMEVCNQFCEQSLTDDAAA
jgi:hypothetical protein